MQNNFLKYVQFRESKEEKGNENEGGISTKITLGEGNDYEPFFICDDAKNENYGKNENLAPIVRAFKEGANWGWSKDDKSGEDKPVKISGKKLYLAGGAVRDHLAGKKPRNMELATNASPDEVYHILKQNDFVYVQEKTTKPKSQEFWVEKMGKKKKPYVFGIRVNGDEYELSIFTKNGKGTDLEPESGTQAQDASSRDFTINSMYILLSNDCGPNKELVDFHGGSHHLKSKEIVPIGDMETNFQKDPKRILRYARMISGYGNPKKVSAEHKEILKKLSRLLKKLDRPVVMDEFKKGMKKDDCDCREYIQLFDRLGLLDDMFPEKKINRNLPKELSEIGDKHMPLAWLLKDNPPDILGDLGFEDDDLKKINFLIKSLNLGPSIDPDSLSDLTNNYFSSGISGRKLKDWVTKIGGMQSPIIDAFLSHIKSPRVEVFKLDDNGKETVDENFSDLIDPFTGQKDFNRIDERKRNIEYDKFLKCLHQLR